MSSQYGARYERPKSKGEGRGEKKVSGKKEKEKKILQVHIRLYPFVAISLKALVDTCSLRCAAPVLT